MTEQDLSDEVPDDMPIPNVAISTPVIAKAAENHDIDPGQLVDTLEEIDAYLVENARDLTEEYLHKYGEEAILLDLEQEPQQHMYVDPVEWDEIQEELDLEESHAQAARAAHNREYERLAAETGWYDPVEHLETCDVLISHKPIMQDFREAGLSYRQAFIQTRRMEGDTLEEIGAKLSIATGTVKTHCNRIDRKIEQAEGLLDLVDEPAIQRSDVSALLDIDQDSLEEAIQYLTLLEEVGTQEFGTVPQWVTTTRIVLEKTLDLGES